MSTTPPQHVLVMTGATSGIGAHAVKQLAAVPGTVAITGVRGTGRSVSGAEVFPLDLAPLASVRAFATAVKQRLGDARIEMLVLNAGAQFGKGQRSADGFEMTFAVNYLAHYLLARLLLPSMAEGSRLEITTSDTHDPSIMPGAPKTLNPDSLAHPATKGSAANAYAASKLCDLLMARSFALLDYVKVQQISVIAYNPGLTGNTSLGGQSAQKGAIMTALRCPLRLMSSLLPQLYMHTSEQSGDALAKLVLREIVLPPGRVYASHVRNRIAFPDPSKLAQSDDVRDLLWRASATMVGLPVGSTSVG